MDARDSLKPAPKKSEDLPFALTRKIFSGTFAVRSMHNLWKAVIVGVLPIVVVAIGATLQSRLSGEPAMIHFLESADQKDRRPLYRRWGYNTEDVARRWRALGEFRSTEQRFLEFDLVSPAVYLSVLLVLVLAIFIFKDGN